MIVAEMSPWQFAVSGALGLIGLLTIFVKWQSKKDQSFAQSALNQAAGNSEEIRKLWAELKESKSAEKQLRLDLDRSQRDCRALENEQTALKARFGESQEDCKRLHAENIELTRRLERYHSDADSLKQDNLRLTKQNEKQAAQILHLEQKLETMSGSK